MDPYRARPAVRGHPQHPVAMPFPTASGTSIAEPIRTIAAQPHPTAANSAADDGAGAAPDLEPPLARRSQHPVREVASHVVDTAFTQRSQVDPVAGADIEHPLASSGISHVDGPACDVEPRILELPEPLPRPKFRSSRYCASGFSTTPQTCRTPPAARRRVHAGGTIKVPSGRWRSKWSRPPPGGRVRRAGTRRRRSDGAAAQRACDRCAGARRRRGEVRRQCSAQGLLR